MSMYVFDFSQFTAVFFPLFKLNDYVPPPLSEQNDESET